MMVRFLMSRIAVKQFAILEKQCPEDGLVLDTDLSFQYSREAHQVACTATFTFKYSERVLVLIGCECTFLVHPDDWKTFEGEEIVIPKSVLEMFALHTVGTTRGILFCKTEGTPFSELLIPPLNIRKMIGKELKELK